MDVAKKIKEIRQRNNLTQEEFATKVHVTRQAVSKWEKGKSLPSPETIDCICREFNVPIDELVQRQGRPKGEEWLPLGERSYVTIAAILLSALAGTSVIWIAGLILFLVLPSVPSWRLFFIVPLITYLVISLFLTPLFLYVYYPYKRVVLFYNCDGIKIVKKTDCVLAYEDIDFVSVVTFTRFAYSLRIQTKAGQTYTLYSLKDASQTMFILNSAVNERK